MNSIGFTFRKDGHTKIIELDLAPRSKEINNARNISRPDVLAAEALASATSRSANDVNIWQDEGYASSEHLDEDDDGMDIDPAHGAADTPSSSDEDAGPADSRGKHQQENENENDEVIEEDLSNARPRSITGKEKAKRGRNERLMIPAECRAHLRRLFANDSVLCSLLYGRHGPYARTQTDKTTGALLSVASADLFFMDVVPVSPTRFRPAARMGELLFEHTQNQLLVKILRTSYRLRDLNVVLRTANTKGAMNPDTGDTYTNEQRNKVLKDLIMTLIQLQIDVNSFMDSNKNPAPTRPGKLPPQGVKQILEKKEGLFRKNMMVYPLTTVSVTFNALMASPFSRASG
jgi:DNA-directed RNA polymerase beta' subunit